MYNVGILDKIGTSKYRSVFKNVFVYSQRHYYMQYVLQSKIDELNFQQNRTELYFFSCWLLILLPSLLRAIYSNK